MPRGPSGSYTYPDGTRGISGQTIYSARYNTFLDDLATTLNTALPINMGGTGGTTVTQARDNLDAEVAIQTVTNYTSHSWETGSFKSTPGATNSPDGDGAATNYYIGTVQVFDAPANTAIAVEARNLATGVKYMRKMTSSLWGPWVVDGRFMAAGGIEGIAGETGDMFYGFRGTSPASEFIVNSESDVTGTDYLVIHKDGRCFINAPIGGNAAVSLIKPASGSFSSNLFGVKGTTNRWVLQLGNEEGEGGANGGSNFAIQRYNDAGGLIGTALKINRNDGSVNVAGSTTIVGNVWAAPSATTGTYQFGTSGTKSLTFDGTRYTLNGGSFGVVNGDITSNVAGTSGTYFFGSTSTKYLIYDGTDFKFEGGSVYLGTGFKGRQGTTGATDANVHNFYYTGNYFAFINNSNVGIITITSDYRTKKDVENLPSMWDTVKALRPIKYTQAEYTPQIEVKSSDAAPMYPADNVERWGFIAHELQDTMIESAATGYKDAPDVVQSPNQFTLIAALTRALQEAMQRIEALEARP